MPVERIESRIYLVRGHKVLLDFDLAVLYQVPTKRLNEQVRRNMERFPEDFMFQLTYDETNSLRSQFATLKVNGGTSLRGKHKKYLPYAFTEQGIAMLSSVLKSKTAIQVNIQIMRTFTKLRALMENNKALAEKLKELESKVGVNTEDIKLIFETIKQMLAVPEKPKRKMGFLV
ncbi:hypothetical protein A3J90_06720 [candidate division WOR-1 bacterium RIFOXYC2_FULL_37_10]|uniref:KilA-N DNA-binding domain-containing protein n=1 Tax=candidate division WOR-1 bacterium RIFOXYB2_FULL_37_13 TaxID=1802579 RepID=A0A1F4SKR1_UNCSA|nr:MAG: hypothetical protein A2310_05335 [candidate division WOR-1 bacterium RIFOXYB2_FULL_37_13]OGC33977.1 MAG: hypothetical protein A3J90_06720 [candidate division WOR-1 bacterium RIFOXYC2_FULL_37_10]